MVEREVLIETVSALVAVGLFVAFVFGVGVTFGRSDLSASGGQWLVAGIALFVLGMAALGWWLSTRYDSDS
jgi:hypothetical protein